MRRYEVAQVEAKTAEALEHGLGVSRVMAHVLAARGLETPQAAQSFLEPSLERDWQDPSAIPGLEQVACSVADAVRAHKRIMVFGDFDVDGITATAALVLGLRELGADPSWVIPLRLEEGYGLSEGSLKRILADPPEFLVTVDNGIASANEVDALVQAGIGVCVTDHHEPGGHVPQGVPVADPKLDRDCPSFGLAGVGVALKLVAMLGRIFGCEGIEQGLLDLAALGTIADQMPLVGENRALVRAGLQLMQDAPRPAMRAYEVRSSRKDPASAEGLAFGLIPKINSAGRVGDPVTALEFLLAQTDEDALSYMDLLDAANEQRREIEGQLDEQVTAAIERDFHGGRGIVEWGEDWHDGVKGIVASRIVGRYGVPTILFSVHDGFAFGSGRTAGDVDLFSAVGKCSDMLVRFGGHAAAIGVTVEADRLEEFRERFCSVLDAMPSERFEQTCGIDCDVELSEVGLALVDELARLEPFGQENPAPRLAARSVFMVDRRAVGNPPAHLSCTATDGSSEVRGIYFRPPGLDGLIACDEPVDIVFHPSANEFRGHVNPQLMITDIIPAAGPAKVPGDEALGLVESLFKRGDEFLDRGDYAGILDAESFHTKVAGVSFEERQGLLAHLADGVALALVREPGNAYDPNAVAVYHGTSQIGYLNARLAFRLAPAIDSGMAWDAVLTEVTGKWEGKGLGANILLTRAGKAVHGAPCDDGSAVRRTKIAALPDDAARSAIQKALIGSNSLHEAQQHSLDLLAEGTSVLCIMVTGRGKSLIFHEHAAFLAIKRNKASVFVFPLRALVADQAYHLQQSFSKLGVHAVLLTGESSEDERASVFSGLADGSVDCVLTTPEFLTIHASRFAATGRVGFLVVDEAHHVGAVAGHRPAYAGLAQAIVELGDPVVLATTATAGTEVAAAIEKTLSIGSVVCDPSMRENLRIDDLRDAAQRDIALARICSTGEKTVVYVNSRDQATSIARNLRRKAGAAGSAVAFYHAGLPRADRAAVEAAFREGELACVVSTSAFGEGVNIPDIRNVVLYHLPFNDVEFNQMSGRAGRDGDEATVHLLYSRGDARINERILSAAAPSRDELAVLYRTCRALSKEAGADADGFFQMPNADIAELCKRTDPKCHLDEQSVSSGLSVFRELGLVRATGYGSARRVAVVDGAARVDLDASTRYLEAKDEVEEFARFKEWALQSSADELLSRFNRPILPTR